MAVNEPGAEAQAPAADMGSGELEAVKDRVSLPEGFKPTLIAAAVPTNKPEQTPATSLGGITDTFRKYWKGKWAQLTKLFGPGGSGNVTADAQALGDPKFHRLVKGKWEGNEESLTRAFREAMLQAVRKRFGFKNPLHMQQYVSDVRAAGPDSDIAKEARQLLDEPILVPSTTKAFNRGAPLWGGTKGEKLDLNTLWDLAEFWADNKQRRWHNDRQLFVEQPPGWMNHAVFATDDGKLIRRRWDEDQQAPVWEITNQGSTDWREVASYGSYASEELDQLLNLRVGTEENESGNLNRPITKLDDVGEMVLSNDATLRALDKRAPVRDALHFVRHGGVWAGWVVDAEGPYLEPLSWFRYPKLVTELEDRYINAVLSGQYGNEPGKARVMPAPASLGQFDVAPEKRQANWLQDLNKRLDKKITLEKAQEKEAEKFKQEHLSGVGYYESKDLLPEAFTEEQVKQQIAMAEARQAEEAGKVKQPRKTGKGRTVLVWAYKTFYKNSDGKWFMLSENPVQGQTVEKALVSEMPIDKTSKKVPILNQYTDFGTGEVVIGPRFVIVVDENTGDMKRLMLDDLKKGLKYPREITSRQTKGARPVGKRYITPKGVSEASIIITDGAPVEVSNKRVIKELDAQLEGLGETLPARKAPAAEGVAVPVEVREAQGEMTPEIIDDINKIQDAVRNIFKQPTPAPAGEVKARKDAEREAARVEYEARAANANALQRVLSAQFKDRLGIASDPKTGALYFEAGMNPETGEGRVWSVRPELVRNRNLTEIAEKVGTANALVEKLENEGLNGSTVQQRFDIDGRSYLFSFKRLGEQWMVTGATDVTTGIDVWSDLNEFEDEFSTRKDMAWGPTWLQKAKENGFPAVTETRGWAKNAEGSAPIWSVNREAAAAELARLKAAGYEPGNDPASIMVYHAWLQEQADKAQQYVELNKMTDNQIKALLPRINGATRGTENIFNKNGTLNGKFFDLEMRRAAAERLSEMLHDVAIEVRPTTDEEIDPSTMPVRHYIETYGSTMPKSGGWKAKSMKLKPPTDDKPGRVLAGRPETSFVWNAGEVKSPRSWFTREDPEFGYNPAANEWVAAKMGNRQQSKEIFTQEGRGKIRSIANKAEHAKALQLIKAQGEASGPTGTTAEMIAKQNAVRKEAVDYLTNRLREGQSNLAAWFAGVKGRFESLGIIGTQETSGRPGAQQFHNTLKQLATNEEAGVPAETGLATVTENGVTRLTDAAQLAVDSYQKIKDIADLAYGPNADPVELNKIFYTAKEMADMRAKAQNKPAQGRVTQPFKPVSLERPGKRPTTDIGRAISGAAARGELIASPPIKPPKKKAEPQPAAVAPEPATTVTETPAPAPELAPAVAEQDAAYLAAVKRGDMETAKRMVDDAAKKAGFAIAYHGTMAGFIPGAKRASLKLEELNVPAFFTSSKNDPGYKMRAGKYGVTLEAYVPLSIGYTSGSQDQYVNYRVTSAKQIKSADPVIYDDQGNVIPLSDRFQLPEAASNQPAQEPAAVEKAAAAFALPMGRNTRQKATGKSFNELKAPLPLVSATDKPLLSAMKATGHNALVLVSELGKPAAIVQHDDGTIVAYPIVQRQITAKAEGVTPASKQRPFTLPERAFAKPGKLIATAIFATSHRPVADATQDIDLTSVWSGVKAKLESDQQNMTDLPTSRSTVAESAGASEAIALRNKRLSEGEPEETEAETVAAPDSNALVMEAEERKNFPSAQEVKTKMEHGEQRSALMDLVQFLAKANAITKEQAEAALLRGIVEPEEPYSRLRPALEMKRGEALRSFMRNIPTRYSLPEAGTTVMTPAEIETIVKEVMGVDTLPEHVKVVNETSPEGPKYGGMFFYGQVYLNAAGLRTRQGVIDALLEEGMHGVKENPEVQQAFDEYLGKVTGEDIAAQRKARGEARQTDYTLEMLREEAAIEKIQKALAENKPEHQEAAKGLLARIWDAIKRWYNSKWGTPPAEQQIRDVAMRFLRGEIESRRQIRMYSLGEAVAYQPADKKVAVATPFAAGSMAGVSSKLAAIRDQIKSKAGVEITKDMTPEQKEEIRVAREIQNSDTFQKLVAGPLAALEDAQQRLGVTFENFKAVQAAANNGEADAYKWQRTATEALDSVMGFLDGRRASIADLNAINQKAKEVYDKVVAAATKHRAEATAEDQIIADITKIMQQVVDLAKDSEAQLELRAALKHVEGVKNAYAWMLDQDNNFVNIAKQATDRDQLYNAILAHFNGDKPDMRQALKTNEPAIRSAAYFMVRHDNTLDQAIEDYKATMDGIEQNMKDGNELAKRIIDNAKQGRIKTALNAYRDGIGKTVIQRYKSRAAFRTLSRQAHAMLLEQAAAEQIVDILNEIATEPGFKDAMDAATEEAAAMRLMVEIANPLEGEYKIILNALPGYAPRVELNTALTPEAQAENYEKLMAHRIAAMQYLSDANNVKDPRIVRGINHFFDHVFNQLIGSTQETTEPMLVKPLMQKAVELSKLKDYTNMISWAFRYIPGIAADMANNQAQAWSKVQLAAGNVFKFYEADMNNKLIDALESHKDANGKRMDIQTWQKYIANPVLATYQNDLYRGREIKEGMGTGTNYIVTKHDMEIIRFVHEHFTNNLAAITTGDSKGEAAMHEILVRARQGVAELAKTDDTAKSELETIDEAIRVGNWFRKQMQKGKMMAARSWEWARVMQNLVRPITKEGKEASAKARAAAMAANSALEEGGFELEAIGLAAYWQAIGEKLEAFINNNAVKMIKGFVDAHMHGDYMAIASHAQFRYAKALEEIAKENAVSNDYDRTIEGLAERVQAKMVQDEISQEEYGEITSGLAGDQYSLERVKRDLMDEIKKRLEVTDAYIKAESEASAHQFIRGAGTQAKSSFNVPRGETSLPPGWYDYGYFGRDEWVSAIYHVQLPYFIAMTESAKLLESELAKSVAKFESDFAAGVSSPEGSTEAWENGKALLDRNAARDAHAVVMNVLSHFDKIKTPEPDSSKKFGTNDFDKETFAYGHVRTIHSAIVSHVLANFRPQINNINGASMNLALWMLSTPTDPKVSASVQRLAGTIPGKAAYVAGRMAESFFRNIYKSGLKGLEKHMPVKEFLDWMNKNDAPLRGMVQSIYEAALDAKQEEYANSMRGIANNSKLFEGARAMGRLEETGGYMVDLPPIHETGAKGKWKKFMRKLGMSSKATLTRKATVSLQAMMGFTDKVANMAIAREADSMEATWQRLAHDVMDAKVKAAKEGGWDWADAADRRNRWTFNQIAGTGTDAKRKTAILRNFLRHDASLSFEANMIDYWKRHLKWKADGQVNGEPQPKYFADTEKGRLKHEALVQAMVSFLNRGEAANRPLFSRSSKNGWFWLALQGYQMHEAGLVNFLTAGTTQQTTAERNSRELAFLGTLLVMAIFGGLSMAERDWYMRTVMGTGMKLPSLYKVASDLAHGRGTTAKEAGMALAAGFNSMLPYLGSAMNMAMDLSFRTGFDLNSQVLGVNMAMDFIDTFNRSLQTKDPVGEFVRFTQKWVVPDVAYRVISDAPGMKDSAFGIQQQGRREESNVVNSVSLTARVVGMEGIRTGTRGGATRYTPASPLIRDVMAGIATGNKDFARESFDKLVAYKLEEGQRTRPDFTQEDAVQAAVASLRGRNPFTLAIGRSISESEYETLMSRMSPEDAGNVRDYMQRMDEAINEFSGGGAHVRGFRQESRGGGGAPQPVAPRFGSGGGGGFGRLPGMTLPGAPGLRGFSGGGSSAIRPAGARMRSFGRVTPASYASRLRMPRVRMSSRLRLPRRPSMRGPIRPPGRV